MALVTVTGRWLLGLNQNVAASNRLTEAVVVDYDLVTRVDVPDLDAKGIGTASAEVTRSDHELVGLTGWAQVAIHGTTAFVLRIGAVHVNHQPVIGL